MMVAHKPPLVERIAKVVVMVHYPERCGVTPPSGPLGHGYRANWLNGDYLTCIC